MYLIQKKNLMKDVMKIKYMILIKINKKYQMLEIKEIQINNIQILLKRLENKLKLMKIYLIEKIMEIVKTRV